MVVDPAGSLAYAADLERRDEHVAAQLERVRALAGEARSLREHAAAVAQELEELPRALDELVARIAAGEVEVIRARDEAAEAEGRLAALEGRRRPPQDQLDRSRHEVETARQRRDDSEREVDRLTSLLAARRVDLAEREAEQPALLASAAEVARELRDVPQLNDPALVDPGGTLASLEDWGARVRAALFVVQGTLETERERIVVEANALAAAVLGEQAGVSSVALVRRQLEAAAS